jgi:hypothetical protein
MDGRKRMESQMAEKLETTKLGKVINIQTNSINTRFVNKYLDFFHYLKNMKSLQNLQVRYSSALASERGDVPGWVLVVLMTTGLVTAIWTIAAPRLTGILKNSLDAMNGIR